MCSRHGASGVECACELGPRLYVTAFVSAGGADFPPEQRSFVLPQFWRLILLGTEIDKGPRFDLKPQGRTCAPNWILGATRVPRMVADDVLTLGIGRPA